MKSKKCNFARIKVTWVKIFSPVCSWEEIEKVQKLAW